MANRKLRVGIVGTGNISPTYFNAAKKFEILEIAGCADILPEVAKAKAAEFGTEAMPVAELLARKDVDLIINLTPPLAHAEVSLAALNAGKHVHSEKPLATTLEDGRAILELAKKKGLLVGCAPDTFLGAGYQTCRKIVDDGWIGRVTSGSAFMLSRGMEMWHPNPAFFYKKGAGPMLDIGPYYITALIHLLGPVAKVSAMCNRASDTRMATCKERFGEVFPVEIPTHQAGTLLFHSGAVVTVTISFDVSAHQHSPIEIYGTRGSLAAPDPNTFGGAVKISTPYGVKGWQEVSHSHPYHDNMRSIGAADMAYAILGKRPHRTSGDLAYHALEVMVAFEQSSKDGKQVEMTTKPERPAPFPMGLIEGRLDE